MEGAFFLIVYYDYGLYKLQQFPETVFIKSH
jgi:hypothetical protein